MEYRKAIQYQPDYAEGHLNLGHSLLECGEPDEAIVESRRAISLERDYGEAYAELGKALSRQRKFEEAIAAYREAVRLRPTRRRSTRTWVSRWYGSEKSTTGFGRFVRRFGSSPMKPRPITISRTL